MEIKKDVLYLLHDLKNKLYSTSLSLELLSRKDSNVQNSPMYQSAIAALERAVGLTKSLATELNPKEEVVDSKYPLVHMNLLCEQEFPKQTKNFSELYGIEAEHEYINLGECYTHVCVETGFQIDENLFENAKKAGATKVKIITTCQPEYFHYEFIDNGKGMNQKELDMLHLGIYQKDGRLGKGTRFIFDFIRDLNAVAYFTSKPGVGTEFHAKLPGVINKK